MINDKALKQLPEQTRRFIVGRSLYQMRQGSNYFLYHLLLPFLCNIAIQLCTSEEEQRALTDTQGMNLLDQLYHNTFSIEVLKNNAPLLLKILGLKLGAQLLCSYTQRSLEEDADLETARRLNCCQGGIRGLKVHERFHNDGTIAGRLNGLFPFIRKGMSWTIALLIYKFDPTIEEIPLKYHGISYPHLRWAELLEKGLDLIPGTLGVHSNAFQHTLWKLPILRNFSPYPLVSHRIAALTNLDNEMKPETESNTVLEM